MGLRAPLPSLVRVAELARCRTHPTEPQDHSHTTETYLKKANPITATRSGARRDTNFKWRSLEDTHLLLISSKVADVGVIPSVVASWPSVVRVILAALTTGGNGRKKLRISE